MDVSFSVSFERFIRTEERRAFPRWPAEFQVRCGEGAGSSETARVVEISETGLVFSADKSYPVGTELDLQYWVKSADSEPVKVKAVVRRNEQGLVALEYLNLRRADRLKILEFGIVQLLARTAGTPGSIA